MLNSAYLEIMASEFIVKSDHFSQLNPLAIDEVRRILVDSLAAGPGSDHENYLKYSEMTKWRMWQDEL
jgi:hypothetical protein